MKLREYQMQGVRDAVEALAKDPYARVLQTYPTGSGKSLVLLTLRHQFIKAGLNPVILTPRLEIVRGFMQKLGDYKDHWSDGTLRKHAEAKRIYTPIRYRNLLLKQMAPLADVFLIDEAHHGVAETYKILEACHGRIGAIGVTATGYRGSPKETKALHDHWGKPVEVIGFRDCVDNDYIAMPQVEVEPLFDDDVVSISGGDFTVGGADGLNTHMSTRLEALAHCVQKYYRLDPRPTMVAMPSTDLCYMLEDELQCLNIPCTVVVAATKHRKEQFDRVLNDHVVLIQVGVVSEGVDLPLRVLIDAKPSLSPVAWMQQLGRITRPTDQTPRYVCTNRNLERHAYLFSGLIPPAIIANAQSAFGAPSSRFGLRQMGLEPVSRFKRLEVPLDSGAVGIMYNLYSWDEGTQTKTDWCVFITPGSAKPLVARKQACVASGQWKDLSKWTKAEMPPDFRGFSTSGQTGSLSERQRKWWSRAARRHGLDADSADTITRRQFAILPVLSGTGYRPGRD